jgi:uncharacterized protein (DUF885 family)
MKTWVKSIIIISTGLSVLLQAGCLPAKHLETTSEGINSSRTYLPTAGTLFPPAATRELLVPTSSESKPTSIPTIPILTATLTPQATSTPGLPGVEEIVDSLAGLPIAIFFEESYRQLLLRDPDVLFVKGLADKYTVPNDRFSDLSIAYQQDTARLETAIFELLHAYDYNTLSGDEQLSYDIYSWYLEDRLQGHQFMLYNFPVNSLTIWGKQNWLVDFMVNYQPIEDVADVEDYLARLSEIDTWVEQLIEGLEVRAQSGIIPPKYMLDASIRQVEEHLGMGVSSDASPEATLLYSSFLTKIAQVDDLETAEKLAWSQKVRDEIKTTFIPAYQKLRDYLSNLVLRANNEGGAWTIPGGLDYYSYALQHETSTRMTPEEVHQLGLLELSRIQQELTTAASQLGYAPDEIDRRLAEDSPMLSGAALQGEFERLIDMADQASRNQFGLYPQSGLVIQQEPHGSLAYYIAPPYDGSAPGRFFVNLESSTPQYLLPGLVFHETIPGHHLQGALTRELDIPMFRKDIEFNAYVEGWALYAEQLAWEMGLYQGDPLTELGRLQLEQMRALRLVVDTGVNALGWNLEKASATVEQLTGSPISQDYLTRFFVLPGQASGYTIGMLKILELRQRAMDQLGEAFDLGEFHDVILGNGPMPLEILEKVVDGYIEAKLETH